MGPGFANFADGHAERCALQIAQAICDRYASSRQLLREAVNAGILETHYVYGNHDYMVQFPLLSERC